jgi:hypothetical protein
MLALSFGAGERPQCAGFFTSGRPRQSRGISPIRAAESEFGIVPAS